MAVRRMEVQLFDAPAWRHALTLAERARLLESVQNRPMPTAELRERAGRRLARWQSQVPFAVTELWTRRLSDDGIVPDRMLDLLATPVDRLIADHTETLDWVSRLAVAYQPATAGGTPDSPTPDNPTDQDAQAAPDTPEEELLGFLQWVNPLIDHALAKIQTALAQLAQQHAELPFDPTTIEDILLVNLPDPLLMRISRTLVLELHVARLQGLLEGDTPQARFRSFVRRLRRPDYALALLAEYPVLARQLTLMLDQWADVCIEFLTRLTADWELICRRFSPDEAPGVLVTLAGGAGDTHRGGRSVMIATFESGFRIVYKPKSLAIDARFQELLVWLNGLGCQPPLRTLDVCDRGDYGWVQHVAYRTCETVDELERFYRRHGAYLALLYALNANDFHFENLIAVGEDPILIDLETVLQPSFDRYADEFADIAALRVMAESALQVGLLPLRLWSRDDYAGIDISGLGGSAGQLTPDRIPRLADPGTDAMRYVRERLAIPGDANRPSLNGVEANAADYARFIKEGFTQVYRLIQTHRDQLSATGGLLDSFAGDTIRVLLRPTRTYDQLLFESFHPDMLRNALDRNQFFDRLWVGVLNRPYMVEAVAAEQADLQRGDIPIFETTPASLDLVNGSGVTVRNVLYETGLDAVRRRLLRLDDSDMVRQLWFVDASLATLNRNEARVAAPHAQQDAPPATLQRLVAAAGAIADDLLARAIYGEQDICWIGLDAPDGRNWDIRSLGIDLAHGVGGITLFLAYAGMLTEDARYTEAARRGYTLIARQSERLRDDWRTVGLYEGWGGVLHAMSRLATLWQDAEILTTCNELVEFLGNLAVQDESFDVARGAAGALLAILAHHAVAPSVTTQRAATACGNHLLGWAKRDARGIHWTIPNAPGNSPLGAGYGNSGIAGALATLAQVTNEPRHHDAAQAAWAVVETDASTFTDADLLGIAGVAPAYLAWHALRSDCDESPQITAQLTTALLRRDWGVNHSLATGDMAALDLLLHLRQLDPVPWTPLVEAKSAAVLRAIESGDIRFATPHAVWTPDLFFGAAGIGYQLLRLAYPARVPSLHFLSPPIPSLPRP